MNNSITAPFLCFVKCLVSIIDRFLHVRKFRSHEVRTDAHRHAKRVWLKDVKLKLAYRLADAFSSFNHAFRSRIDKSYDKFFATVAPDNINFLADFSANRIGYENPYYHVDVRAHTVDGDLTLVMTNCVFGRADKYTTLDANGYVTNAGVANTRRVTNMRFADAANGDYTPTTRSPLYGAGCQEPWLLSFVGATDLAGNPRVFGKGVDIGAYECQKLKPGTMLLVW